MGSLWHGPLLPWFLQVLGRWSVSSGVKLSNLIKKIKINIFVPSYLFVKLNDHDKTRFLETHIHSQYNIFLL